MSNTTKQFIGKRHWTYFIGTLLTGGLLALAHSLNPAGWAAWWAFVPLSIVCYSVTQRQAFLYGALAGLLASFSLFGYLSSLATVPAALALSLLRAVQYGIVAGGVSFSYKKLPPLAGIFFIPAVAASLDLTINLLSPHGSGGSIAYSQMNNLAMIQSASIGSTVFVTFVIFLFSTGVSFAVIYRTKVTTTVLFAAVLLLAINLFGNYRLTNTREGTAIKTAALAADKFEGITDDWSVIWEDYRSEMLALSDEQIDIFLLPEKIFIIDETNRSEFLDDLQILTEELDAAIIVGVDEREGESAFNRAYFAENNTVAQYDKIHMIPGYESHFEIGQEAFTIEYKGVQLGIAICKDLDFPQTIRAYGEAEIDLMLVPAWDFYDDDWFHSRMAVLRGVENGFSVVRSARRGFLTQSNADGAISAETRSDSEDMAVLISEFNAIHTPTIYSRFGDLTGWVFIVYSLSMLYFGSKDTFKNNNK